MPKYIPGTIQLRGMKAAQWAALNPVIPEREMVCETDTLKAKLGDGHTRYNDLEYKPGAKGDPGEPGRPGQDGAMALTLADDSLVNEGTATNPKLKVGDLSGTALATLVQTLSDQMGQLMGVGMTRDENTVSFPILAMWAGSTWQRTFTAQALPKYTFWVAPYACRVTAMTAMFDFVSQAVDATNYIELELIRWRANSESSIVSKSSADEAIATRTAWDFAGADWDSAAATLQPGDGLAIAGSANGTADLKFPATLTLTVQPT